MKKRLVATFIGFCIIIIVGCLYISVEGFEDSKPYCILLTTCVNRKNASPEKKQEILKIYRTAIDRWLETDLPIIVVDSSDYKFNEYKGTRLQVCSFTSVDDENTSITESESILYAINSCRHTRQYKTIIKITGRYFIEDFKNIMTTLGNDSDVYIQHINNPVINWQHSEVFGFKKTHANHIFSPIISKDVYKMEMRLWEISHSNYRIATFPKMRNVLQVLRGGDGLLVDPL